MLQFGLAIGWLALGGIGAVLAQRSVWRQSGTTARTIWWAPVIATILLGPIGLLVGIVEVIIDRLMK